MNKKERLGYQVVVLALIVGLVLLGLSYYNLRIDYQEEKMTWAGRRSLPNVLDQLDNYLEEARNLDFKALKQAVLLLTYDTPTSRVNASAVVIDKARGYIVSNQHVIQGHRGNISVYGQGEEGPVYYCQASLLKSSQDLDLALLKLDLAGAEEDLDLEELRLGDASSIKLADTIYTISSPKKQINSLNKGIVSALRYRNDRWEIQLSSPLYPGDSGGALIDSRGQLIGILTYRIKDAERLGYAVSVRELEAFLGDLE